MINASLNFSSIVGIALAIAGAGLYVLRSYKPTLARDYDIFFSAVALLCGGILIFQGWRQDPILQFGQFLLGSTTLFFGYESIRLRGIATEQARRNAPIVDEERPVAPRYQAAYPETDVGGLTDPYNDRRRNVRRISASRDNGRGGVEMEDEYGMDRRPPRRRDERPSDRGSSRRLRPRDESDDFGGNGADDFGGDRRGPRGSQPPRSRRPQYDDEPPAPRRPRSDAPPSEYVDYRPIDNDEEDNWGGS